MEKPQTSHHKAETENVEVEFINERRVTCKWCEVTETYQADDNAWERTYNFIRAHRKCRPVPYYS